MSSQNGEYELALDLGAWKAKALVFNQATGKVIAAGAIPGGGIRRGKVAEVDECVETIRSLVKEASSVAGLEFTSAHLQFSTEDTKGELRTLSIQIKRESQLVRNRDIKRLLNTLEKAESERGRCFFHYAVGNKFANGLRASNPVGLRASRVSLEAFLVSDLLTTIDTYRDCLRRAGLNLAGIWSGELASAHALLNPEEKELGVVLIDLGHNKTSAVLLSANCPRAMTSFPIGIEYVVRDIETVCNLSRETSRQLLFEHGSSSRVIHRQPQTCTLTIDSDRSTRQIPSSKLTDIISERIRETLLYVRNHLLGPGYRGSAIKSVVVCGGGAKIPGVSETAGAVFGCPGFRVGLPQTAQTRLSSPTEFSSLLGIALLVSAQQESQEGSFNRLLSRVKKKLREFY